MRLTSSEGKLILGKKLLTAYVAERIRCALPLLYFCLRARDIFPTKDFLILQGRLFTYIVQGFVLLNFSPGANPTIASYNASIVNFYNATGSLARFENKNIIFYFLKRSSLLQRWRCS
jgi:hypothetical protein